MHPLQRLTVHAVAAGALCAALPAAAQYQGIVSLPPVGPGESRLLVGGSALFRPAYHGSSDRSIMLLPLIDYAHVNGFFASSGSGIGYSFINSRVTQVGVRLIPQLPRQEGDSAALRWMGDLGWGVEASAYATQRLSPNWVIGANIRAGGRGGEFDAGARYDMMLARTTRASVFGFGTAGNAKSQQTWFGVDAGQSLASGYPVYSPGAGFRSLHAGVSVNHFFAGRWFAIGGIGFAHLLGDAADSPIVRDRTTVTGFVSLAYQLF
jgi:outer membrane scaffolding protein for murein synthesis (MipA/OmpV family)